MRLTRSPALLSALLATAGAAHLVAPAPFARIVPRSLGRPGPWVTGSGLAELACAAGLLPRRARPVSALASAALLVAVYPANVRMARDALAGGSRSRRALALARLPVQVPLVLWALAVARRSGRAA